MTVSAQTPLNRSTGNGVTTVFPYNFKVLAAADMEVSVDGDVKTLTTHYTLSGVGTDGGNVTMLVAPANGAVVVRRRNMAYVRTVDFQDQGELPTDTLDDDQDSAVLMAQQLGEGLSRAVQVPITSTTDPEVLIQELLNASAAAVDAAGVAESEAAAAVVSAAAAAASAASTGLPSLTGKALNMLRVKADESGYEARSPGQTRSDIGAAASGSNNDITSIAALASVNTGQLAGLRNAVINGNGLVQQRSAPALTAALQYGAADRHLIGVTGATSVSGTVGVLSNSGFSCGVGYGAIAASWTTGQFILKHRIEAANSKQFNGKTVTVSGKLYQDTGGSRNFTVSLGKPTTTADTFSAVTNLGTSGAIAVPSGTVTAFSYTLALGATDASLGLEPLITDNAANTVANKNYVVSDLQVEVGSVATVFEQRHATVELALCQRYYTKLGGDASGDIYVAGYITSSGILIFPMTLPTAMRAIPTATVFGTWSIANVSQPTVIGAGKTTFSFYVAGTSIGPGQCQSTGSTTYLTFNAEL